MKKKLLLIGIDSFDAAIMQKLKTKLPNFFKLNFLPLQTTIPPETPVAWSAAATGKNPGGYGIFDFLGRDTKTYMPKLNLTEEKPGIVKSSYTSARKGKAFWHYLNEKNIPTTLIRWPVTFPAEKINGRMLSGLGVVDLKGLLGKYTHYTENEIDTAKEGYEKKIKVSKKENIIETIVSGPLIRKASGVQGVENPMQIEIMKDSAKISVDGDKKEVNLHEWSKFFSVEFKVMPFYKVKGIFNVYILSLDPFEMYLSSVQIDPRKQVHAITYPEEYGKELVDTIGLFSTLGMPEDTKAVTEGVLSINDFKKQISMIEKERESMFWYEFNRFEKGVLAFVFDAGDRLKHIFWKTGEIAQEIEDYYIEKDMFIGEIIDKLDDETGLIIFSDHGFTDFEYQVNVNSWLQKKGYLNSLDNGQTELLKFVDWTKTKAYSFGFTSLYLNLEQREGQGIVKAEEKEAVSDELRKELLSLEHNGKKVFTNIYKASEVYAGDQLDNAPDLILGFNKGFRMSWKSASGILEDNIISKNKSEWKGDHLIDRSHVPGILFSNITFNNNNAEIIDIAASVLDFFNLPLPKDFDGKSLIS